MPYNRVPGASMKIVIDRNIPAAQDTFGQHGELIAVDGRQLDARAMQQIGPVDALIVRSVTRVDDALLRTSRARFVGTATIGTDHLDKDYLQQNGITWASAPGCNADAAAQYTLAMMLLACQRLDKNLTSSSVGIVGLGNVGGLLQALLTACGVRQLRVCDPPRAQTEPGDWSTLREIAQCDIVTLHVPLSLSGPHATRRMIDKGFLQLLKPGSLLLNTSRGPVIDGEALKSWLGRGAGHAALDVWPDEPHIDAALLTGVSVATPHVAGYSVDGKTRGTLMIYDAFCRWQGLAADACVPAAPLLQALQSETLPAEACESVRQAVLAACPVARDDAALSACGQLGPEDQVSRFDGLRKNYPARRDFAGWKLPEGVPEEQARLLKTLGFH